MDQDNFSWTAPEFEYREKKEGWYWVSIIVAILILVFAVWQRNFLFAFFVMVAEIMIIVWGEKRPKNIDFSINERGLNIGQEKTYSHKEVESYGFLEEADGEWLAMVIGFKKHIRPKVKIRIPKGAANKIRSAYEKFAPEAREVEIEHSLLDAIERLIKF